MFARPIATTRERTGIATGKLGVWWLIASEIVIFGGLLGSYVMHRLGHPEFGLEGYAANTDARFGITNTIVLLVSSLFAVRAHHYADKGDGKKAAFWLWCTIGGAIMFLCVKSVEWSIEISHGLVITKNAFWAFYYTAAGIHGCHVIGGAIIMGIVAVDAAKGKELQRVELCGLYWHFVDLIWIFLFPLLYIAK